MSQENMENIMQRRPQYGDDEIRIARGVPAGSDPTAAIKAATGLDINLEDLQDSSKQARQEAQQSRILMRPHSLVRPMRRLTTRNRPRKSESPIWISWQWRVSTKQLIC